MEQPQGRGVVSDVHRGKGLVCIIVRQGELKVGDTLQYSILRGDSRTAEARTQVVHSLRWQAFNVPVVEAGSSAEVQCNAFGVELPAYGSEITWMSGSPQITSTPPTDAEADTALCFQDVDDGAV